MRNLSDNSTILQKITLWQTYLLSELSKWTQGIMYKKQHTQLCFLFWALSHTLTNQSIKKLSKTANATETQKYRSLWVGSNNRNWQGQIPCSPVCVRWAYSQTPQIPLSKHNHMVSQLFETSCATVYLAWLPCPVEECCPPLPPPPPF